MNPMRILIDNGHGKPPKGKQSPDGRLLEWQWNREVAQMVCERLDGYQVSLVVPEDEDIALGVRCSRVNAVCNEVGARNALLVSIHCNAAGSDGEWKSARGWSCFTSKGQTRGDELAECLYQEAELEFTEMTIRRDRTDGDSDKEENFTILKKTACAACLVENFFMDNKDDCEFLLSDAGKRRCADVIAKGIERYIWS